MGSIRVAIVGVGNCASSLVQGVEYYKDAKPEDAVPGLMHVDLGGYHISDISMALPATCPATSAARPASALRVSVSA